MYLNTETNAILIGKQNGQSFHHETMFITMTSA